MNGKLVILLAALAAVHASPLSIFKPFTDMMNSGMKDQVKLPSQFDANAISGIATTSMDKASQAVGSLPSGDFGKIFNSFLDIPLGATKSVGKALGMEEAFTSGTDAAKNIFTSMSDMGKNVPIFGQFLGGQKSGGFGGFFDQNKMPSLDSVKNQLSGVTDKVQGQVKEVFGGAIDKNQLDDIMKGNLPNVDGLKEKLGGVGSQVSSVVQKLGEIDMQSMQEQLSSKANEIMGKLQNSNLGSGQLEEVQKQLSQLVSAGQTGNFEQISKAAEKMKDLQGKIESEAQQVLAQVNGMRDNFAGYVNQMAPMMQEKLNSLEGQVDPQFLGQMQNYFDETLAVISENISQASTLEQVQQLQDLFQQRLSEMGSLIN